MSAFVGEGTTGPADDRPLNDQEYQLLQRLLSDPFSIPQQFKTWLVSYLESSDLTMPLSSVLGLNALLGVTGAGSGSLGIFPAGMIFPFGGASAPVGSLLCDGGSYLRTAQARLFAAIGVIYGAPDGNTFRVPDIQERVPIGKGVIAEHDSLGETEGRPLGQRGALHGHTAASGGVGDHVHEGGFGTDPGLVAGGQVGSRGTTDPAGAHSHPIYVGPGGSRPLDGPGYITLNFVIVA